MPITLQLSTHQLELFQYLFKWTKILSLEIIILSLKMMVKSVLEFILKFTQPLQRYLLSYQANSAFWADFFLHWAAATLKGLGEVQNKKFHFPPSF